MLERNIKSLSIKRSTIKKNISSYDKDINEVSNIKIKQKDIQIRTSVIKALALKKFVAVNLLNVVAENIVHEKMWLTYFEMIKKRIIIRGVAIDDKTVAEFMSQIENSGCFSSVDLKKLQQTKVYESLNMKNFEILCGLADKS